MSLEKLFNPKSIAIVGASEEDGKVGNVLAKNVLTLGYAGKVFLVNPKYDQLFGQKCYPSLTEIEEETDLAILAIPAKLVNSEIEKNALKIKNYAVISAGFSEIGKEGREREDALSKITQENNLNILGPNCLGFVIPELKLNASFAGGLPEAGNIAFVSQSGALAVALMDLAKEDGLKFSHIVSVGNKMQLSETELLRHFALDSNIKVIGMYLEGIKNGQEFMAEAKQVSRIKPVVILKAGRTEKSQKAISSHTGALAGSAEIMEAVFGKIGIIQADTLEDFVDLLGFISKAEKISTDGVAVVTNAGGPGVLTTDAFFQKEVTLLDLPNKTKKDLRKFLPEESSVENPIDLLGDAKEDRYKKALAVLGKVSELGSIACLLTPQDQTPVMKIAKKIIQFKARAEKLVVTSFIGGTRVEKAVRKMKENGIYNFSFPERAISALGKYYHWSQWSKNNGATEEIKNEETGRKQRVDAIIAKAKLENRQALYFSESREIMKLYGVSTIECVEIFPETLLGNLSLDKIVFPAVLKVDSEKVLHKTERGGVRLGIVNQGELEKNISEMREAFPGERLIIQSMLPRKTELILGIKKDLIFGPILVYGLGGIYTEVLKMVNFLVPPFGLSEIEKELKKSKISFLFQETRGQKPYDISELAGILFGIEQLSREVEEINEFDINPLLIYNDGNTAVAVDVKIVI